jgi:hypothetical protein
MNSSAWTTTAYRAPRCSRPRAPRGDGKRNTSPRTTSVKRFRSEISHLLTDKPHLNPIGLVGGESLDLFSD